MCVGSMGVRVDIQVRKNDGFAIDLFMLSTSESIRINEKCVGNENCVKKYYVSLSLLEFICDKNTFYFA